MHPDDALGSMTPDSHRLNSPVATMTLALVLSSVFVLARLAFFGGDASRFVVAGEGLADPARVPAGLYVLRSATGYDGQAYYRLALDPMTRQKQAYGITLDTPEYRQQRIVYPFLAWAASGGGSPRAIPWALIGLNVAALAGIGFVGGAIALQSGRHALWGSVLVFHPGFMISVARDLSEALAWLFILAGVYLLRRNRSGWAALALTTGVLTRETTVIVPLGLAVSWVFTRIRGAASRGSLRPAREFLVPLGVLAGWELLLYSWWDSIPFTSNKNATQPPFVGIVSKAGSWLAEPTGTRVHYLLEIAFILAVLGAALYVIRSPKIYSYERWALAGAAVTASILHVSVWDDHAHFLRALTELYMLSALIVLIAWPRKPRWLLVSSSMFTLALGLIYARTI